MNTWAWRTSVYDPWVFIHDQTGLIIQVHVDDMAIFGSNPQAILDFKNQIASQSHSRRPTGYEPCLVILIMQF